MYRDGGGLLGEDFSYRGCWAKAKLSLRTPFIPLTWKPELAGTELNVSPGRDPYHARRLALPSSSQHWRNKRLEKEGGASVLDPDPKTFWYLTGPGNY